MTLLPSSRLLRRLAAALLVAAPTVQAQTNPPFILNTFFAAASPSQQPHTPAISTAPRCLAVFTHRVFGLLEYQVFCNDISGITSVTLNAGTADTVTGTPIVTLFDGPTTSAVTGLLTVGSLRNTAYGVTAFNNLLIAMRTDGAYVNVITTANPDGEVRGQVSGTVAQGQPNTISP